jgi:hypothetical protein
VTPPATGQHRPRKRGRRQAGRRRHWERGVARGLAEAPRRRALSLSLCVASPGGARHRRPAPRWVDVTKAYQTRSYGFVPPFYSPFGHEQAYNRISGQMSTKPTWRRLAPLVLGLGRRLGGARRHEALIRQNRAHGQIHCHVSAMSASSVHVVGGASQISWPA